MLFGSPWVEESNAAIVEVEGDGGTCIGYYGLPRVRMAADILDNEGGADGAITQQHRCVGIVRCDDKRSLYRHIIIDIRPTASGMNIITIASQIGHVSRLQIIGQTEVETPQLAPEPFVVHTYLCVGIVRAVFVDDIAHEAVVGRRLYAETPTVAYAPQPYPSPFTVHSS